MFIEDNLRNFERQAGYYLDNPILSAGIAERGYNLAKKSLGNEKLAEYVLEAARQAIGNNAI